MKSTIHIYPGMGATKDMYPEAWTYIKDCSIHDWVDWRGESSIEEMAKKLILEHDIKKGDIVIGSSLGGIVGCEIANQISLKALVLIGSAVNKVEINQFLNLIHPLIDYTPVEFIKVLAGKVPLDLSQMFSGADSGFIRAMCRAIFNWEGLRDCSNLYRIHGSRDLVIPNPQDVDTTVKGGHLIAMTDPRVCVGVLVEAGIVKV